MRWQGERESENVEDRRGAGRGFGVPGGRGLRIGGGGLSLGGVVVALVLSWLLGINPLVLLGLAGGEAVPGGGLQRPAAEQGVPADDQLGRFVSVVLASTEDVWRQQLPAATGMSYREPRLVLFRGATPTACGRGQSAMGPFYCPADERIYIDLGFYDTLRERLGAPGDFAQAYVIAHEVGHHVQKLLGLTERVDAQRGRVSEREYNALSVRLELQADCLAGVWAHHADATRRLLEQGDIEEALNAAAQIGDDTLQRRSQGQVVPESFTHGSSAQRQTWFRRGLESGSLRQCDTFDGRIE
ncbi:neutral zinc metallopeptidase [Caldimonas tepidiphila]|uniref:KPN_02809 family neutral zinc metallopeptidase n=1 Tax=Caldimonas tepidiphila TaxID=2315841 RepID=UPI000E5A7FB1|nr:neutral zinc metallopeptidase [Caldimonas tepidiphila]